MKNESIHINGRYWSVNRREDGVIDPSLFGYNHEALKLPFDNTAFMVVDVYGLGYDEDDPIPENKTFGTEELFKIEKNIINKKIGPALSKARERNMKIIFLENRSEPYLYDENSEYGKYCKRFWGVSVKEYFSGGLLEYSKVVEPHEGEYMIKKRFYGGFTNSELDYLLQNLGIKNIFFVGFTADICLFFTMYEAWTRNYKVILLRDATLALEPDEESVKNLTKTKHSVEFVERYLGHTIETDEFIRSLR
jgi:nicotinamidase-related amidase